MQGAAPSRDDRAFSVRVGIALTKVEDESRADDHFEEHDERDAYVGVELRDGLPETHDDGAGGEIYEEVAETVACQDAHKRVHPKDFIITGFPVALHVFDEYACGQEKQKGFETKKGDENVYKVWVDAIECAERLSGQNVGHR